MLAKQNDCTHIETHRIERNQISLALHSLMIRTRPTMHKALQANMQLKKCQSIEQHNNCNRISNITTKLLSIQSKALLFFTTTDG